MAILKVKSVEKLRKFAIAINHRSCTYIRDLISLEDVTIPVSVQITTDHFRFCEPRTFNFGNNIIVIVVDKDDILIVPFSAHILDLLDKECYNLDTNIFMLKDDIVTVHTFIEPRDKRKWRFSSLLLQ